MHGYPFFLSQELTQELTYNNKGGLQTHEKLVKAVYKSLGILAKITMVVKKIPLNFYTIS